MRIFVSAIKQTLKNRNDMLSNSITKRAEDLIIKGMDVIEAVKQAIIDEQNLISEMIEHKTERSIKAKSVITKNTYGLIHINS